MNEFFKSKQNIGRKIEARTEQSAKAEEPLFTFDSHDDNQVLLAVCAGIIAAIFIRSKLKKNKE